MAKRVVYRNQLDGTKRVLIGGLDAMTALDVLVKFGDVSKPQFYMGRETRIEDCDGTPDGAVIEESKAAA
jgi:hypothetical protein